MISVTKNKLFMQIPIFLLIFLMMFAPAELMKLKIIITCFLFCISLIFIIKNKRSLKIHRGLFWWFCIYIFSGIIWTGISVINGNPDPTKLFVVNVISPIIYLIFIVVLSYSEYYFKLVKKTAFFTLFCILLYNLTFTIVVNVFSFFPIDIFPFIQENLGGMNLGFIKFTSQNISYLLFLIPFFFTLYFSSTNNKNKSWILAIIILGILNAIFSGRTAFILALAITPILIIVLGYITKFNIRVKNMITLSINIILLFLLVSVLFKVDMGLLAEKLKASFSTEEITNSYGMTDSGGQIRINQFNELIYTWKLKPILGWGDGAPSIGSTRAGEGGVYELSYIALLMQRGIIGFLVFFTQLLWIYIKGKEVVKGSSHLRELMFCTLVGFTTFMLANATNPYLYSFDRLLIFFYPLLIINYYKMRLSNN